MRQVDNGGVSARVTELSVRQFQVLKLVAEGLTNKQIASRIPWSSRRSKQLGEPAVKQIVSSLLQGFGCGTRTALTAFAFAHPGLLERGVVALDPHPPGCTCGFSYCPEVKKAAWEALLPQRMSRTRL